jgi:ubiquitin C-terminal hydrolase
MPGEEILISFGQLFLAFFLRDRWNTPNQKMLERYRIVKQVYSLTDFFTRTIFNEYTMSNTISEKLDEFNLWELGKFNSLNNLSNTNNSCYMASLLQCISHIPALSRLLLETDLCNNISQDTFLFNYIQLLKGLINKNKQSKSDIDSLSMFFKRNRNVIMNRKSKPIELIEDETDKDKKQKKKGEFNAHQDPEEFFTQLKSRFCEEFTHFEYIIHHLFGFYSDKKFHFHNCNHSSTTRAIDHYLQVVFPDPKSFVTDTLENLMLHLQKDDLVHGYKCTECERTIPKIIPSNSNTELQIPHLPNHQ